MDLPKRKHPRLRNYDYSQNGAYFITLCTRDGACILSRVVGPDALIGPEVALSEYGEIVDAVIRNTNYSYNNITVDNYVIMPNHVHILLLIYDDTSSGPMGASGPTISVVIRAIKALTTRQIGQSIWQSKFHDHIIRDEQDYLDHWQYIDNNPAKWSEDEYYFH